jgi:hypothetical protein
MNENQKNTSELEIFETAFYRLDAAVTEIFGKNEEMKLRYEDEVQNLPHYEPAIEELEIFVLEALQLANEIYDEMSL